MQPAEFKDKTSDIDQQIDDEIDEMFDKISGSDYTPVSFVSADNKDIGLVQFAIRTEISKNKKNKRHKKREVPRRNCRKCRRRGISLFKL